MFATTHVLASVVISQHTPNLWWAFLFSLFSHYLLDLIPHGDKPVDNWIKKGPRFRKSIMVFGFDSLLITIFFFTLYQKMTLPSLGILLAAIFGGMLPDILWVTWDFYKRYFQHRVLFWIFMEKIEPILDHHYRIHHYIENLFKEKAYPHIIGALVQIIFAGIFIVLALYSY